MRGSWNSTTEALFSAWIEKLFDAPPDQDLSWKVWSEVLRDQSRNFLFNYLGRGEDNVRDRPEPDCADFVYFLRAYFAYKMGLPFGYSNCSRGIGRQAAQMLPVVRHRSSRGDASAAAARTGRRVRRSRPPPRRRRPSRRRGSSACFRARSRRPMRSRRRRRAVQAPPKPKRPTNFAEYLRDVGDVVHTGAVRVVAADDNTDFYTVPLTRKALRPGTVYADPYGHVLMLVHLVPEQDGKPGVFLAVDAEPDGSITRKRFWRGNFLFVHDPALGSPGFKHFRPIVGDKNGPLRRLTNAEIAKNPQYGDFSLEQSQMSAEDFYDRMDDVMSPEPLDPVKAMTDAIASLYEQVKVRVTSVENGRKYQEKHAGDYRDAGRSLDLRDHRRMGGLFHAGARFPPADRDRRGAEFPRSFRAAVEPLRDAGGKSVDEVKRELQGVLASELASRKFSYTRSDGSQWTLSLKDVIDRIADFEMAYNPNDCAELRWAAPEGSEEASTCKRHAPQAQRDKMAIGLSQLVPRAALADAQLNAAPAREWRLAARKAVQHASRV